MTAPTTFAARAVHNNRLLIQYMKLCFGDLEEYQAMGGANWSVDYGDFTETQIDNLMGALNGLKTYFEANQGYFYEGAE